MMNLALTIAGRTEYLPEDDDHRASAMLRYWTAKQAGDTTAKLVRVEEIVPANGPMPDDDPPPAAPASAVPPVNSGEISELAVARIRLQESWCAKAGFALAPPLYAPGTRVLPLGDTNFRIERRRVESLPPFPEAAASVVGVVKGEARDQVSLPLHDLAMTDNGTLLVDGQEHALDIGAFYQLAVHAGFGMGARYLSEKCDGELRATNVNAQIRSAPDRTLTLRTRKGEEDTRTVYATVTPTYAPVDTDTVLSAVAPALTDARTEMVYDGTGVRATALWMPDRVVDLAAGDIFKAGVRIETDDTGRGRVRVSAVVFRNRCLNLIIIGEGTVETVSAVHKGDGSAILTRVIKGVDEARTRIADFLDAWGHARTVKLDPELTIHRWVEQKRLAPIPEKQRDSVVKALMAAWHKEPGDTLADCVNAVSRAAHEHPFWGMDFRAELERQAARLVMVAR